MLALHEALVPALLLLPPLLPALVLPRLPLLQLGLLLGLLLGPPSLEVTVVRGRWVGVPVPQRTQQGFQGGRRAGRLGRPTTSSGLRGCPRAASLPPSLSVHGVVSL